MIDVHLPEHRIRGVRDFFLSLFTITVGLLIALTLENAVEAWHHHHQREEAEATIRAELMENRAHLIEDNARLKREIESMKAALVYLQARSAGQQASPAGIYLGYSLAHLQSASWHSANATGVVQYMPYDRVQRLAEAYDEQDFLAGLQTDTLQNYLRLNSYIAANNDLNTLSQEEIRSAMSDVRNTMARLVAIRDVREQLMTSYEAALK